MSELRLITDNLHEVAVGGCRVLFHVPTTALFELDAVGGEVLDLLRERGVEAPSLTGTTVPEGPQDSGYDLSRLYQSWWEAKTTLDELIVRFPSPPPPIAARITQWEGITNGHWNRYWGQIQRFLAANP